MFASAARERFTAMVELDDDDIDLLAASILIAQEEYPEISVREHVRKVDRIGERLEGLIDADSGSHNIIFAINHLLFEELGFRGNSAHYDDPDNSMMNRMLERRKGIPITLSVLYIETARRAGVELDGVNYPGHFLVRMDENGSHLFIDPFHRGRVLLRDDLLEQVQRRMGEGAAEVPEPLGQATRKDILSRMLFNLKAIYARRRDIRRTLMAVERLVILKPGSAEERRDRGILYGLSGYRVAAIADLEDYLDMRPEASDADQIRRRLKRLHRQGKA